MIRSSKSSLKFSNLGKRLGISTFINEYRDVMDQIIDIIWDMDKIPNLLPIEITSKINSNLSARAIQCAAKQASGIVRGTRQKQKQRLHVIKQFQKSGQTKKASYLQKIYDTQKSSKPKLANVNPELDSRFVKIDLDGSVKFDLWVKLSSIGNKRMFNIPLKRNEHFNRMLELGVLKGGIRLSANSITFMFEIPDVDIVSDGNVLGIDVGASSTISASNGFQSKKDIHAHDLKSIMLKLTRKKVGSKAFKKAQDHRKNFINYTINQLNLDGVKQVNLEKIKNLRKNKRTSRYLSRWTYTEIFEKIESRCEMLGVQVNYISPTYTSRRCSGCGWTCKGNRKGSLFKCKMCGYSTDADLNASSNIALNLPQIHFGSKKHRELSNKKGFYWTASGAEFIVPPVEET